MFHRIFGYCALIVLLAGVVAGQDSVAAGTYKGQWTGAGGSGDIHITFRDGGDGKLTPEVGFTLGGQDVTCKVLSFKPEGAKFRMVYEFDAQGTMLQSAIEATVTGKTMEGTYKTTAGDQSVDSGTWKATAL
jgi:opacity protein-like surface antigen